MNSALMMLLGMRGRLDPNTLHTLVSRGNDKRRSLITRGIDLFFGLFMLIFGRLKLKDADGFDIDTTKPINLSTDAKVNALLAGVEATQRSVLWRELLRPTLLTMGEFLARLLEPDENMLAMLAGGAAANRFNPDNAAEATGYQSAGAQATTGWVAPPAPPIDYSAPVNSPTNPIRSRTGGL